MFSILIPTWNNLAYLKICVESIRKNSTFHHQIILHINDGNDGSLQWAINEKITYTHSVQNIGICKALNNASKLANTAYICYFNDDMYALPGWDYFIVKDIETIGHQNFFISSTMIEPKEGKDVNILQGYNFGDIHLFKEKELINTYKTLEMEDWSGASWPPNVVPKTLWDAVGGYSEEFSPGMYSDPDFSMKLWQQGVRYFKGIGESKVYHFMSKSTGKVIKNDGRKQFMQKWKITSGYFYRSMLKMGKIWQGELKTPVKGIAFLISKIKASTA